MFNIAVVVHPLKAESPIPSSNIIIYDPSKTGIMKAVRAISDYFL